MSEIFSHFPVMGFSEFKNPIWSQNQVVKANSVWHFKMDFFPPPEMSLFFRWICVKIPTPWPSHLHYSCPDESELREGFISGAQKVL